jgi:cephalosporin hydroxylase
MTPYEQFKHDCREEILAQGQESELADLSRGWMSAANVKRYSYHFDWMGRPIIQYPQDMIAMQQIIWDVKPDLIIETGIAHGGSLVYYASLLELIAACGEGNGEVLGVDIEIRPHNRAAIEAHPMKKRITMIEGSSIAPAIIEQARDRARGKQRVLVCLDSNHTHDHVLAELEAYAPLVTAGSYCVVFDTLIEDLPQNSFPDRPWGNGNNPKTAVWEYLKKHPEFEIDKTIQHKLLITVAPDGYLKRIR